MFFFHSNGRNMDPDCKIKQYQLHEDIDTATCTGIWYLCANKGYQQLLGNFQRHFNITGKNWNKIKNWFYNVFVYKLYTVRMFYCFHNKTKPTLAFTDLKLCTAWTYVHFSVYSFLSKLNNTFKKQQNNNNIHSWKRKTWKLRYFFQIVTISAKRR